MEKWKNVVGWEGLYEVSDLGRVKSIDRMRPHWRGGEQKLKGRILRQIIRKDSYYYVHLSFQNNSICCSVSRLVCMAFHENADMFPVINHKDSNKRNNHVDNLEWCSISYNTQHAWDNNRFSKSRLFKKNR